MEQPYKNRVIGPRGTLLDALKQMDRNDSKLLMIIDGKKFTGIISVGDVQRAIIKNIPLSEPVVNAMRSNFRVASEHDSFEEIKKMMLQFRMEFCPVVDSKQEIVKVYFWEDLFSVEREGTLSSFNVPVVIMAGGFGTRLRPLTNVLPKPLIPIGDKTMVEEIFDRFARHGCDEFYLSLNYKADFIEYYLNNLKLGHKLHYIREPLPMGTAGSLSLLKGRLNGSFFVNNCDILIDQDYSEILKYHREHKNELTIVAALKTMTIPYGLVEAGESGQLTDLQEKPDLTIKINSGMYVLEPHLLDDIPQNTEYHITHLIKKVRERNGRVGVFPVSERSWQDIGDWKEFLQTIKKI